MVSPGVVFVPTPPDVGMEMLKLAGVTSNDLVYDLGSGDGRLVIAAAQLFGARAVGVELDAKLVQDSREAAAKAGVADRVTFIWGDLFQVDLRPATAVMLYLTADMNLRLRPRLLSELKPGTPVVSHAFDMGEWTPDRSVRVFSADGRPAPQSLDHPRPRAGHLGHQREHARRRAERHRRPRAELPAPRRDS